MKDTDTALRYANISIGEQHSICCGVSLFLAEFSVQVNPDLKSHFEEKGFRFVGQDVEGERMEVIELDGMKNTTYFVSYEKVNFHVF